MMLSSSSRGESRGTCCARWCDCRTSVVPAGSSDMSFISRSWSARSSRENTSSHMRSSRSCECCSSRKRSSSNVKDVGQSSGSYDLSWVACERRERQTSGSTVRPLPLGDSVAQQQTHQEERSRNSGTFPVVTCYNDLGGSTTCSSRCCLLQGAELSRFEGRSRKRMHFDASAAAHCPKRRRGTLPSLRRCLVLLSTLAVIHACGFYGLQEPDVSGETAAAAWRVFTAASFCAATAATSAAGAAAPLVAAVVGSAGAVVAAAASASSSARESSGSRKKRGSSPSSRQGMRILYPPRPLQVVRPNDRHTGFEIDEEALKFVEEIPAPVSVIAAVGSIHTGKSFFLSQLLAFSSPREIVYYDGEEPGAAGGNAAAGDTAAGGRGGGRLTAFPVGYTVQPGTQGLTFWSEPLRVNRRTGAVLPPVQPSRRASSSSSSGSQGDGEKADDDWVEVAPGADADEDGATDEDEITNVLLLDTEGFGGPNVTRSYDQLLYAVASLLSSHILFTTMKMIDAQSLQLLEDMTKDTNLFNLRAHAQALNETALHSSSSAEGSLSATGAAAGWSSNSAAAAEGAEEVGGEGEEAGREEEEEEAGNRSSRDRSSSSAESSREERGGRGGRSSAGSLLFSSLAPCCLSWVVQDFAQDLEDLTAQQWLERLIDTNRWSSSVAAVEKQYWRESRQRRAAAAAGDSAAAAGDETHPAGRHEGSGGEGDADYLKHSLRSFYEWIDCVALPAPAANADALQRLDLLPLRDMTEPYRREFEAFRMQLLLRAARRYKVKQALALDGGQATAGGAAGRRSGRGRCPAGAAGEAQQQCAAEGAAAATEATAAAGAAGDTQRRRADDDEETGRGGGAAAGGQGEGQQRRKNRSGSPHRRAMSGKDLAALLRFLVRAANLNMFEDVQIFMNHFSAMRSELTKNDLLLLYDEDMKQFLKSYPPPLPPSFFRFADQLQQQVLQQWQQQTRGLLEEAATHAEAEQQRQQHDALTQALQEKLERFRATAEEQVRLYCRGFCEKQVQQIEQHVQQQQQRLPISPQALSEWSVYEQRLQRSLLAEEVDRDGLSYSSADVCAEELRAYEATVENLFLYFHKENTKKIYEHMQTAETAAVSFFSEQLQQHPLELLRPLDEFRVLLFEWKASAWDIFEQRVADLRSVREAYVAFEERLREHIKKLEQQALQQWNSRCAEIATEVLKKWEATYKAEVVASFPRVQALPVDEEILAAAAANKAQEAMQELSDIYCAKAAPWQKVYRELRETLHARQKELETQNVEAIKITCKEPLDRLTKTLQAKDFYLWGSFAAVARREAAAVLSAQHPQVKTTAAVTSSIVLSDKLIKKVTDHWVDTDIRKAHAATIRQNFNNLLFQIFGLICLGVGLVVVATWSFGGTPLIFFGLWCIFGFATLLGWLREAFKFTVEGLWNGLQNRLGFEVAAGTCFLAAAISGGLCWRWWTSRRTSKACYGTPLYSSTCMPSAYSVDPMASYAACGAQVPLSSLGQTVDFQQSMGLPRCSVLPNTSFVSDIYPDTGRRSRFSSATYLGGQQ